MIGLIASLAVAITDRSTVELRDATIRVGDIIEAGPHAEIRGRPIARLPAGIHSMTLTKAQLRSLIGRAAPGLEVVPPSAGSIRFTRMAVVDDKPATICFETIVPLAQAAAIVPDAVRAVACDGKLKVSGARFDASRGAVVADRPLPAATYLGTVRLPTPPNIARGDQLVLRATSGPVTIERPVTSLQPSRSSAKSIFVRTDDGAIVAAPIAHETQR